MTALTEEQAAFAFAKAWNRLEPDEFLALLAPNACYASQWVFDELAGSAEIAKYLRGKMDTVRAHSVVNPDSKVQVEIGRNAQGSRPCAFMTQGQGSDVQATVVFDVAGGKIQRYDLCIPQIMGGVRTGIYPV